MAAMVRMPDAWNRRVARLKSRYERGDELELERLIGEAVAAEREACAEYARALMITGRLTPDALAAAVRDRATKRQAALRN